MISRSSLALALLALSLAACGGPNAPAPVEIRGVGAGETSPGMAGQASSGGYGETPANIGGTYTPPPGYGVSRNGITAQSLDAPSANTTTTTLAPTLSSPSYVTTPPAANEPNDAYSQATTMAPALQAPPAPAAATQAAPIDQGNGEFGWPIRGRLISGFGPKTGGQANDGYNISAPVGSSVYAAKDGTVAYAGNGLRSYGNMVLLRHSGGMFTVYAHLDQIGVAKDQTVTKGQVVGTSGQSGGVAEPQLHFEVRRGSTPLDPSKYLSR